MNEVSFLRHAGWVGPETLTSTINIIGCGATGSHIALTAARMGFTKFRIWDADKVESHNLPNQAFMLKHIGMNKATALRELLLEFNPRIECICHEEFFTTEQHKELLEGILVLTVDTQSGRKDIYDSFYLNPNIDLVVETKLGFDYAELHLLETLDSSHCEQWLSALRNDEEIEPGPCNLRICTTLVGIVSNYAVHSICAKFADENWKRNKMTIFTLDPVLKVISF